MKKLNRKQLRQLIESTINEKADTRVAWKDLKPKGKVLRVLSLGIAPLKKKGVKFIKGDELAKYYKEQVGEEGVDEDSKEALSIIAKQMGGSDQNSFVVIPGDEKYAYVIQSDKKTAKAFVISSGNITKSFKIPPGSGLAHAAGMHKEKMVFDNSNSEGLLRHYEDTQVTGPLVKMVEDILEKLDTQPETPALDIARSIALANGKDPRNVKVGDTLQFPKISKDDGGDGYASYDEFYTLMIGEDTSLNNPEAQNTTSTDNIVDTQRGQANESLSRGSLYRKRYHGRY